ncbi:helix-turn-helix domain-containing protein [Solirubrobacter ginsenosidimutans]|uniref:Helix-turn-helix domain-containing protein n=1 Tax=Solirubrobacter ginsenosidimutans TaxID=490573 RepID=A0A9X3MYX9_9ACTN|nr:helix-turn-helix domain-containing protein [Solirubrobacter ginsenosidimutans]MDA0165334.1 helix-turn-helix domain-containing protein [Solirubrobacter ginsenosidimutans]
MLDTHASEQRVSTGLDALDAVLGGLYWGDNVVWQLDGPSPEPFYRAIARLPDVFITKTSISIAGTTTYRDVDSMEVVEAGTRGPFARPADLLREVHRLSQPRGHRLILFDSLDAMVHAWGAGRARDFFARCCPMLLELGAIAYWSMDAQATPATVRDTVHAVTQCVLNVDERSVRVAKAEGRDDSVRGTVLHWHQEGGRPIVATAEIVGRVAASIRAVRRSRHLSQHDLGDLAGVSASAISQVEHAERGLSLATLVRLSSALGVTIDDLLRGKDPGTYRIGRRTDDPQGGFERTVSLLGDDNTDLWIDLVHLGPREAGAPTRTRAGTGIVGVASGLVQVQVAGQTPAVRHGEVLVADSEFIAGWRNLGQSEAELFWIVSAARG